VRRDGLAGGQRQVHIDFTEEKHRTGFTIQQQGVLAAPALPASGSQFGFKHGGRISEDAVTELFDLRGDFFAEGLQAAAHDLVVVTPPRVHRHDALGGALQAAEFDGLPRVSRRCGSRQVVHARRDDADGAGNQLGRARALEPVRGHVVHVAMKTRRQPGEQSRLGRSQINTGDANLRESKLTRPRLNLKNQLMTVNDHPPIVKNIVWLDEAATAAFAQRLARQPAIDDALIELQGDLGAGKTTFVRHLLGALGVQGRIKSPTYAVVEPYTLALGMNIWHFDFFRFNDPREWEEAGFRDIFASPGLKLVEWPDKAGDHLPPPDLLIAIDVLPDESRAVALTARTATGEALLS
jgi:tRNA threonylcarbamoyladenosine biosynthesis protein TsaE